MTACASTVKSLFFFRRPRYSAKATFHGGAQLFLLKNSRLEYHFILLSNKTQGNRGACFSSSISDLSEQLLEVTPVLLQNICKDRRDVGIVERYVDSSGQILVHEFCIGRMFELEFIPQDPIECLVFEGR